LKESNKIQSKKILEKEEESCQRKADMKKNLKNKKKLSAATRKS
jgi:hypothetical protein